MTISVRRYLLQSLIAGIAVGSLVTGLFIYFTAIHEINQLYDKNMQEVAELLQTQLTALSLDKQGIASHFGPSLEDNIIHEEDFVLQIWKPDGQLIYSSHRAIAFPLQKNRGLFQPTFDGHSWRAYVLQSAHGIVQVAQPQSARSRFIWKMTDHMLLPLMMQIPVIILFIWLAVGRSLAPLAKISQAINKRSAISLEPLNEDDAPAEVKPMMRALNALLSRLQIAMHAQQQFTADAAHELRTPLTALQLQLGILGRAGTEAERDSAIAKLQQGIARATHLVQQLLTMARLDPEAAKRPHTQVDMATIARTVIEQFAPLAIQKHIDLGHSRCESTRMAGDAESLRILVSNLIDNAIRYTPEGGRVDIATYSENGHAIIEVADNGIGIPETERERIFERFHRVVGTGSEGTGLGLAIVQNIIVQHKGQISVKAGIAGKGTAFIVRFQERR